MKNLKEWMKLYEENLRKCNSSNLIDYCYTPEELPTILLRMEKAFERGSYNKDSLAIKLTCKHLNLKHTYKSINDYLEGII